MQNHFSEALQTMTASKNEEVILIELKLGLEFLNLIVGTKTNEDMLDKLFNSFASENNENKKLQPRQSL